MWVKLSVESATHIPVPRRLEKENEPNPDQATNGKKWVALNSTLFLAGPNAPNSNEVPYIGLFKGFSLLAAGIRYFSFHGGSGP